MTTSIARPPCAISASISRPADRPAEPRKERVMAEVLGIGMHHTPHYRYPVGPLAGFLKRLLARPGVPEELRDPRNWPAGMRAELGDDGGLGVMQENRRIHLAALRLLRVELDAFAPDLLVIFGDDQRENFQEEIIPPFCLHV